MMHRCPRSGARRAASALGLAALVASGGCRPAGDAPAPAAPDLLAGSPADLGPAAPPATGMRRLSIDELGLSLADVLGIDVAEIRPDLSLLPADSGVFDNDYPSQVGSTAFFDALFSVVGAGVGRALRVDRRDALVGCVPRASDDAECLAGFVQRLGRRAWRRPLTAGEASDLAGFISFARESGDFYSAVDAVARALLLHPSFVYRVEIGVPAGGEGQPGVFQLTHHELATRLAFTLWGRTPPDWLLDLAGQGMLGTPDAVRAAATRLIADPRAGERVRRYHAMWLGYAGRSLPGEADFTRETDTLVDRVTLREPGDYLRLFTHGETWVNRSLQEHYGLPAPASFPAGGWTWIAYGDTPRAGILGHRSLLANGALAGDTSPVRRGKFVLQRLLCTDLGRPPPGVNADMPPPAAATACKRDRYAAHAVAGCQSCHSILDPIGFSLENYDLEGRYRASEPYHAECSIDGRGALPDGRAFAGPRGLIDALLDGGELERCAVRQWYTFVIGRPPAAQDERLVDDLLARFQAGGRDFRALLVETVADPMFAQLRREAAP